MCTLAQLCQYPGLFALLFEPSDGAFNRFVISDPHSGHWVNLSSLFLYLNAYSPKLSLYPIYLLSQADNKLFYNPWDSTTAGEKGHPPIMIYGAPPIIETLFPLLKINKELLVPLRTQKR